MESSRRSLSRLPYGKYSAGEATGTMIRTTEHAIQTKGHCDVHDLTPLLRQALAASGLREGQALIFVAGSTAGVTTVEFEPGLVRDLHEFFEKLIPENR